MRPGVTIALTAVDRRRLGAIVGNRNVPQKHAWRARDRAVDGGRSWHRRDHAPDGQVEDLRLALAGTLRRRRGRPSRNIAFPISDLGSRYRAPGPVKHDDADLRERALGDAGTYFFRVVKITGDGFLIEFSSPVEAVRCAREVQEALAAKNPQEPNQAL